MLLLLKLFVDCKATRIASNVRYCKDYHIFEIQTAMILSVSQASY